MVLTENELDAWVRGHSREAQGLIVDLVAMLTATASPYPTQRRFPHGDSIGQHGADGFLDTAFEYEPFLPAGKSYWEIGTGGNAGSKATSDYRDLTGAVPEAERKASAFVFVTPRSGLQDWEDTWKEEAQSRWLSDRRKRDEWASVHVIDGTRLVEWLGRFPAVERYLLRRMGLPGDEISSVLERWDDLRTIGDPPPLTPRLFTVNRDAALEQLRAVFGGTSQQLRLDTYYPDQVPDFVAAFVAAEPATEREDLAGRAVIVSSPEAMRALLHLPDRQIIVPDFDMNSEESRGTRLLERARRLGHAVVYGGLPGGVPHPNRVVLASPRQQQIRDSLEAAGYPRERARTLAQRSGGNLSSLLRALQNLSLMPEWAESGDAADLAVANLLGSWSERQSADMEVAEIISGNAYGEWIARIRSVALRPGTPMTQRNRVWKTVSRYEAWYALGPRLFDQHLESFRSSALRVLAELDPKFELPAEDRSAASIHGKVPLHSYHLRNGIAESVALLGAHGTALTSATRGAPEAVAQAVVEELLRSTEWQRWATLEAVLPLLAEAAPEAFLDAVEAASQAGDGPVDQLFHEERPAFSGGTLMSGLLWALESLAWNAVYLTRVLLLLAALAERDPGGSWSNRPINSLSTILRPWLPQTTASADRRETAVRVLADEHPDIAWTVLKELLPSAHQISTGSHRPTWRSWIPADWSDGVTVADYEEQVRRYMDLAAQLAQADIERLAELLERVDDLPPSAQDELVTYLESPAVAAMDDAARTRLWTELVDVVNKHRKFADAEWAMPAERVAVLSAAAGRLEPARPSLRHRRLFSQRDMDLFESKDDFALQRETLAQRRRDSVSEILAEGGVDAVVAQAAHVEAPSTLGVAFGEVGDKQTDRQMLPDLLHAPESPIVQLAGAYVWARFRTAGWSWVDSLGTDAWQPGDTAQFLAYLPFDAPTWRRARALGNAEAEYWRRTPANPFDVSEAGDEAVSALVGVGRPRAAVRVLAGLSHRKEEMPPKLAASALLAAVSSDEPVHQSDSFDMIEVIQALQNHPATDPADLFAVEWAYVPLLDRDHDASPSLLERLLADDPSFYLRIIRSIFRPSGTSSQPAPTNSNDVSEEDRVVARNAYELLHGWRRPPGTTEDRAFDANALTSWWTAVRASATESGHLEVAATMLGHVLAYAPADPDGTWIHRGAAILLNKRDSKHIRQGFRIELYNSRGAHFASGGAKEHMLAREYAEKAAALDDIGLNRVASEIRILAEGYEQEAASEAERALHDD